MDTGKKDNGLDVNKIQHFSKCKEIKYIDEFEKRLQKAKSACKQWKYINKSRLSRCYRNKETLKM